VSVIATIGPIATCAVSTTGLAFELAWDRPPLVLDARTRRRVKRAWLALTRSNALRLPSDLTRVVAVASSLALNALYLDGAL